VGAPDVLRVTILPEPEITREAVVRPDGMISIDLVGDVKAAGRTVSEIAAEIEKRIAGFVRSPKVTVALVASKSRAITVLGHVYRPSSFPLDKETRVSEALGLVAGPTEFGAGSRIRVIRYLGNQTRVFKVDLDAIQAGDLQTNIVLEGGDVIYVPPTVSASIGFAIRGFFFPLQMVFGIAGPAAGVAMGGV
jgi:polysaccharide export outer membrane protein